MAIHPPWNTTVSVLGAGPGTEPEQDRWGRDIPGTPRTTEARVKYSGERVFTSRGDETVAKLEVQVPDDFPIYEGETVTWVDRNGVELVTRVAAVKEVLDYPGVVQYRKVWTE